MNERDAKLVKYILVPTLLALLVLWVLAGLFRTGDPNAELSRTTRQVVEAALNAQRSARRGMAWGSVFRIAGMVTGIVGPLVVAYLIYRTRSREEIRVEEMLDVLERHGLIELGGPERRELTAHENRLLEAAESDAEPDDE